MNRLLLIDDEEAILAAMAEYFTALGYRVDCAAGEASARALVDRHDYRVVITDLCLSRGDRFEGLEILGHIRNRCPQTACVVLTAHGCAESEARARQLGASAFLQKTRPLDDIAAIVAELAGRCLEEPCPDESRSLSAAC